MEEICHVTRSAPALPRTSLPRHVSNFLLVTERVHRVIFPIDEHRPKCPEAGWGAGGRPRPCQTLTQVPDSLTGRGGGGGGGGLTTGRRPQTPWLPTQTHGSSETEKHPNVSTTNQLSTSGSLRELPSCPGVCSHTVGAVCLRAE
ncbi:hypothetical protein SKAU_G00424550 [Synaphobranchus kaupii]|uniref:Uncharacterized protein n=1 Tax=Synaphobranchus kaupii TaxID=118154 RepID=A0A9Q1E5L4_SYNKA|nr:hypothetical protein SKAU_G00424550 [Synaphobranchus kaupii]